MDYPSTNVYRGLHTALRPANDWWYAVINKCTSLIITYYYKYTREKLTKEGEVVMTTKDGMLGRSDESQCEWNGLDPKDRMEWMKDWVT